MKEIIYFLQLIMMYGKLLKPKSNSTKSIPKGKVLIYFYFRILMCQIMMAFHRLYYYIHIILDISSLSNMNTRSIANFNGPSHNKPEFFKIKKSLEQENTLIPNFMLSAVNEKIRNSSLSSPGKKI